jgi:signal transduction histidine kinase
MLPKVFERYATDGEGAGIGLPISKELVESHGGKITVESEWGKETTVRFTVPVLAEGAEDVGKSDDTRN